jgi:hypothetical protein
VTEGGWVRSLAAKGRVRCCGGGGGGNLWTPCNETLCFTQSD